MKNISHTPVLLVETIESLLCEKQNVLSGQFVDATFGRGGHTSALLANLPSNAIVHVFDRDPTAINVAEQLAATDPRVRAHHAPFSQISCLPSNSIEGILFDLGVSSPQLDESERGFSFRKDGPLDMRMDNSQGQTVAHWLGQVSEVEMIAVIKEYGEERFARPIAQAIINYQKTNGPITRTVQLANIVASAVKTREKGQHPATRTFQAFRIFINTELGEIEQALEAALRVLTVGGKLAVISFHSLEDRIVKQFITKHSRSEYDRKNPLAIAKALPLKAIARIKPQEAEIKINPRSRSAIMRVAQKVLSS